MHEWQYILLVILLVICGITDILYKKVYNIIVFPAITLGIIMNYTFNGISGLKDSLLCLLIIGVLFFILFVWGAVGAGDAKLMMAISAIVGLHYIFDFTVYSVLAGGIMANVIIIKEKIFIQSWKHVLQFFLFLIPKLKLKRVPLKKQDSISFPFAYGISIGSLFYLLFI